jgi:hypothetical protein
VSAEDLLQEGPDTSLGAALEREIAVRAVTTAAGAGAASRHAVGTPVFGGMLAAAIFGVFVIPMLYVVFQWLREREVNVSGDSGIVITDDYNPLESLQITKAEHYRDLLIERVGKEILFR